MLNRVIGGHTLMVLNCVLNNFNAVIVFVTLFETRFDHEFCVLIKVMPSDTV